MEKKTALNSLSTMKNSMVVLEQKLFKMEADLRIEREWRTRLQTTSEADKEAIARLRAEMTHLQTIATVTINALQNFFGSSALDCVSYFFYFKLPFRISRIARKEGV